MKRLILILVILTVHFNIQAQTLSGNLKQHAGQKMSLTGFNYYESYELAATTIDSLGNFTLNYPASYKGMGVLKTQDNSSLIVALTEPLIQIKGTHLKEPDSLQFLKGVKNKQFVRYAKAYIQAKRAYKAWRYLQPIYNKQNTLKKRRKVVRIINKEIKHLEQVNANNIKAIPENSYLRWFLPIQTLVNNMPETIRNYTERLPQDIKAFRTIDFNDPNFKTSGLFENLITAHYFLLENSGRSLDSVYIEMNKSTDYLIENLAGNEPLLNEVSEELLKLFEKRSLYPAAAHLSNKMLNQNKCVLNDSLAKTMQKYKRLKVGNIAPDIQLNENKTLSSIKKPVLLVFGASWCPHCKEDALKLLKYYYTWKKEVEVVYISIDTNEQEFKTAYQNAPWQTYCDYKGWDTQAAIDYYVNATPTYILLDEDLKILVHPSSLEQVDAWVNYKLNK